MPQEILRGRDQARMIKEVVEAVCTKTCPEDSPVELPLHFQQWRIIFEALDGTFEEIKTFLHSSPPFSSEFGRTSNGEILLAYVSAKLAREMCELEVTWHRQGKILFAIPGIGHEVIGVALEHHLKQTDAVFPYYRQESVDLMRGGTVGDLLRMTAQREGDSHSGGRVLAGHPASAWRNEIAVISSVGANVLPSVGMAKAFSARCEKHIAVCHIGDASMAEGEVSEALQEAVISEDCPWILVVHNNGGGISTDAQEGSIHGDPIAVARGLVAHGLNIIEADATNVTDVFTSSKKAVELARRGKPVVLHFYNVYKRTHSTSDDPSRYSSPSRLKEREKLDSLTQLREVILNEDIVFGSVMQRIDELCKKTVLREGEKVLNSSDPNQELLYQHVYASNFFYGKVGMKEFHRLAQGAEDLLQSTREPHANYIEAISNEGPLLNMRQHETIVLAEELKRHPMLICYGQDIADYPALTWASLPDYLEQKIEKYGAEIEPQQFTALMDSLEKIQNGLGHELDTEIFALLADVMEGKGGVFKTTQYLQLLFGRHRIWNSRLAEASIVGTALGYSLAGFLPIVEIQFDAYWSPAYQQIVDQLSTLRWRSNGQFNPGMVIRIQGMNRLGGVGGIGHGDVILGKLISIPGIRVVTPADASEAGPLLRESIRVAREHGEVVIFLEPIMELNSSLGRYQGSDAHIPLGEAQVRQEGEDFLVLTYGNNVPLVEKAQLEWRKSGISATIINLRTLGVQTDWKTIVPYIEKHGKILIVETERGVNSAGSNLSAQISEHFFSLLDAPVARISARNFRTPAGKRNEEFALPQQGDIVEAGIQLANA